MDILGVIVAVLFFTVGLAGTILPILPGAPLIWLGMLAYGVIAGFGKLSVTFFVGQALAVILIFFIDYAANAWGVRRYGGSKAAMLGGLAGLALGVLVLGPVGMVFGPFAGAVAGDLVARKSPAAAVRSGMGTVIGLAGGLVLKLLAEAGMIIWFFATIW